MWSYVNIVERQLNDHLEIGIYGSVNDEWLPKQTEHSKLTNIPAENLFGDLDSSMRRKPNPTLRHHSSVSMIKKEQNNTLIENKIRDWNKRSFKASSKTSTGSKKQSHITWRKSCGRKEKNT